MFFFFFTSEELSQYLIFIINQSKGDSNMHSIQILKARSIHRPMTDPLGISMLKCNSNLILKFSIVQEKRGLVFKISLF